MKFLAGFEANGFARSDADFGSGSRIAPDACFSRTHIEDTEAAQFNALTLGQSPLKAFEYGIDRGFGFVPLEAGTLNHLVNDVLFYQGLLRSGGWSDSVVIVETF
jgi:hypothetical protein